MTFRVYVNGTHEMCMVPLLAGCGLLYEATTSVDLYGTNYTFCLRLPQSTYEHYEQT